MPTIHNGDCIETMKAMPPESVDAIVCDPPYGLSNTTPAQVADTITKWAGGDRGHVPTGRGFMGKSWDAFVPPPAVWDECMRVLKPGGHMVVFAGSRTQDLMGLSIRLAGFEIRDSLAWLYGSGFPKSHDVGKAIDKAAPRADMFAEFAAHYGARRKAAGLNHRQVCEAGRFYGEHNKGGASVNWEKGYGVPTPAQWDTLAPLLGLSSEWLPLIERVEAERTKVGQRNGTDLEYAPGEGRRRDVTVLDITAPATPEAAQWDGWGTALKPAFEPIVLARKPLAEKTVARNVLAHGTGAINVDACRIGTTVETWPKSRMYGGKSAVSFTSSAETISAQSTGSAPSGRWPANVLLDQHAAAWVDEQSGVSVSKRAERGAGKGATATYGEWGTLDDTTRGHDDQGGASRFFYTAKAPKTERPNVGGVQHPTVKPLAIMRWLIRLVTPPGGVVLDPFAGSGTTIEAALIEGFDPVGIEMEADYLPLIQHRIDRQAGTLTA